MKKALFVMLACLGLAAMLSCATAPAAAAGPTEEKVFPKPEGPIAEAVFGTPSAIDGSMEPAFAKARVIETTKKTMGETAASAKAWMVWDYQYLYVHFEVKDPKLSDANNNPWEKDSIEVFIDELNTKTDTYTEGDAQYRVNFKNVVTGGTGADITKLKSGC